MFKKKCFLALLLVSGFLGCCGEIMNFWNLTGFELSVDDFTNEPNDDNIFESDSIIITLIFEPEFIASAFQEATMFFTNSALALSCPDKGELGMKDPIVNFNISSNHDYNDITAGMPLNDKIIINRNGNPSEWLEESVDWPFSSVQQTRFKLKEKPAIENHQFTVELTTASGTKFMAQTEEITWR